MSDNNKKHQNQSGQQTKLITSTVTINSSNSSGTAVENKPESRSVEEQKTISLIASELANVINQTSSANNKKLKILKINLRAKQSKMTN
jgi:hypothetical protein